jgi:hypothetical protein
MKKKVAKKVVYQLKYKDFIGRSCVRKYKASCIVEVMDEAKKFVYVNRVTLAKVVTPTGKVYYV